jgi:hypothetical protein
MNERTRSITHQPIQAKTLSRSIRSCTCGSPLRRGFVLLWLVIPCIALSQPGGQFNKGIDRHTQATPTPTAMPIFTPTARPTPIAVQPPTATPYHPSPTPPPNNTFLTGLYSYFKLDEVSGSGAIDSAYFRNLVQTQGEGTVGSTVGVINTSRVFPGTGGSFFRQTATDFSPGGNHFFATLWVKAATLNQLHDASFIGKFSFPNAEWLVYFDVETHQVEFDVSPDGVNAGGVSSTSGINNTTNWYFIAAGWDGTNIKVSVNGEPYVTASFSGPVFRGSTQFCMGTEGGSQAWNGEIDEVAIWIGRNDLTISEVQQLYNNGAGLPFSSFR